MKRDHDNRPSFTKAHPGPPRFSSFRNGSDKPSSALGQLKGATFPDGDDETDCSDVSMDVDLQEGFQPHQPSDGGLHIEERYARQSSADASAPSLRSTPSPPRSASPSRRSVTRDLATEHLASPGRFTPTPEQGAELLRRGTTSHQGSTVLPRSEGIPPPFAIQPEPLWEDPGFSPFRTRFPVQGQWGADCVTGLPCLPTQARRPLSPSLRTRYYSCTPPLPDSRHVLPPPPASHFQHGRYGSGEFS